MKPLAILLFVVTCVEAQPEAARKLNEGAIDAYSRSDFAAAERLARAAIAKWQILGDAFAAHAAVARINLAEALAAQGRRGEAMEEARSAVRVLTATVGPRDPHTLVGMNLLAAIELAAGQVEEAERTLDEAVPIARAIDAGGLNLSRTLHVLACLRLRQRRFDEALPLAEEARHLAVQDAGDDSFDAALTYATVAEVHRAAGRPDRALPLYRLARAIYEKRMGPDDIRVAPILTEESLILIDEGEFVLAERQLKHSLAIVEHSCPLCGSERWSALSGIALLRTRERRYAEADRLFTQVLALEEQAQPLPAATLADTLTALATVRRKENRAGDADRLTQQAAALSFH
jgi:tetratricopeptide (TPR) repeat protein